ncbi:chymotrypsinogen B-like [Spodoptera frugiperda]|uniref:Chymotrypsinogen B-like n=1 Tax=Spodoptera frugiperda TaxID=7108 RepID=A0A9R0DH25_SPOFR|nr:chymotrypsinogen B-like [Spodoptera frugiperda]
MRVYVVFAFLVQNVICEYDRRVITTLKYSKYSTTPAVVNGKPAVEGQFPFLVSLKEPVQKMEPDKIVWKNLCGGSIIDHKRVLTAAHCFENNEFYYARHPEALRVVAGAMSTDLIHSGKTETNKETQWRSLAQVLIHEHFSFPAHDIAIVVVNEPWVFNENVNYIKLATKVTDYAEQCVSAGYGRVGHRLKDTISPILLTAKISTMPRWRCSLVWEMNMNSFICTDSAIADVARGDSGGPLMCYHTGDPNEVNDEGLLAGVVSGKNFDKTTLYTRVSAYHPWIDRGYSGAADLSPVFVTILCLPIIPVVVIYLLFYCNISLNHCPSLVDCLIRLDLDQFYW